MLKKILATYNNLGPNIHQQIDNLSWLFFEKVLVMGVGLFVGVWVARYLGAEQFGLFNYATSFVALFYSLVQLGLPGIVVRELIRDPESKHELLGTTFALKLIGGIASLILSVITVIYLRPEDTLSHLLVGIIAGGNIFLVFETIDFWFQSQVQSKYTVFSKLSAFLTFSIVKVILIQVQASLIAFAIASSAEIALGSIGLIIAYKVYGSSSLKAWFLSFNKAKILLSESWPLFFSGAAIMIQAYIDQVMLGQMIGDFEVGQYSVAMKFIAVFGFIPVMFCQSVAPVITKAKLKSQELYFEKLENIYRLMFIFFLIISIPLFFFSQQIVVRLYGREYEPAGVLLSLFAIRLFFTNFGVAKGLFITNESLFKYSLVTAIIGTFANVVMNYFFIPQYGSIGALWATIASFFITIFLIDLFVPRMRANLHIMIKAVLFPWKLKFSFGSRV